MFVILSIGFCHSELSEEGVLLCCFVIVSGRSQARGSRRGQAERTAKSEAAKVTMQKISMQKISMNKTLRILATFCFYDCAYI